MTENSDTPVPDWVPPAVVAMASVLPVGEAVAQHLLTDERMRAVWRVLKAQAVTQDAIEGLDSLQRLETWDIPAYDVSLQDQACAAFFSAVVIELGVPKDATTSRNVLTFVKPWRAAAEQCQLALDLPGRPRTDPELAWALSMVGDFFEDYARFVEQANKKSPYFLMRSSGQRNDDEIRGKTRALAATAHRIFGSFLYGTVATVATVALQLSPEVDESNVRDWCAKLPCQ